MFTNEEARALIDTPKYLENPDQIIDLDVPKLRIDLISREEPDYRFFIQVISSRKMQFKMTLHSQEKKTSIPLVRIDYKGSHTNPDSILDTVPEYLKRYAGREFTREAHIHFYVQGYKLLVWAMPLSDYDFQIQRLSSNSDYVDALVDFAKLLKVQSELNIQGAMML